MPVMMRRRVSFRESTRAGSSGGGKYCSTRRHLACTRAPLQLRDTPCLCRGAARRPSSRTGACGLQDKGLWTRKRSLPW